MKKILITGALGVIWRNSGPLMADPGQFHETDILAGDGVNGPVQELDLLDYPAVEAVMEGVDAVVHLAIASERHLRELPEHERNDEYMRVNVLGTQHVFEAARAAGVKKVVSFSSITTVMGEPAYGFIDAETPPRPSNLYACTKLFGEHLAELYSREHGMSFTCLRLGQPCPVDWLTVERFPHLKHKPSAELTAYPDIAAGITAALAATGPLETFYLVSAHQPPKYELATGRRLGYEPAYRFEGLDPVPLEGA